MEFKDKKAAVLGAGVEGASTAIWLLQRGATVTVLDQKHENEISNLKSQISKLHLKSKNLDFKFGKDYLEDLDQYDIIVRSPGVKRNLPELVQAQEKGVKIISQTKIFFDLCPCPIIGVTGTKGKGTTASLIYEMLKIQGADVYLGGNIGVPPLDFLDKLTKDSRVVLELSSFQLQDLNKSPHIAVMLMVVSEHLNYHADINEYVEAKRNILKFQTASNFAILNRDYIATNESDIHTEGKVFYVSREREVEEGCFVKEGKIMIRFTAGRLTHVARPAHTSKNNSQTISRSLSERRQKTDISLEEESESSFSCLANDQASSSESTFSSYASGQASRDYYHNHTKEKIAETEIIDAKNILLPGKHNLENVCAAVMAATLAGVEKANIVKVLKTFKGLEHRLELVGEVEGVKYYDDSFSTTPETAIAAIQAFKQPEILILGGSSKRSDFTELGKVISEAENIKAIIGIGEEWGRIKAQFRVQSSEFKVNEKAKHLGGVMASPSTPLGISLPPSEVDGKSETLGTIQVYEGLKTMQEVIQKTSEIAKPGDVVLLSPACASFGMFKNYKDRGEQFKEQVEKIKDQRSKIS